jgi:hypothetical protein
MENPLRSEAAMFRWVLGTLAVCACVVVLALVIRALT